MRRLVKAHSGLISLTILGSPKSSVLLQEFGEVRLGEAYGLHIAGGRANQ